MKMGVSLRESTRTGSGYNSTNPPNWINYRCIVLAMNLARRHMILPRFNRNFRGISGTHPDEPVERLLFQILAALLLHAGGAGGRLLYTHQRYLQVHCSAIRWEQCLRTASTRHIETKTYQAKYIYVWWKAIMLGFLLLWFSFFIT